MGEVAESVPLGSALSVQGVEVIVAYVFVECFDFMFECFTAKCWLAGDIEWEAVCMLVSKLIEVRF